MSLGWLNLQEYLGANQGSADEMAQRLDAQQAGVDAQASQAAVNGNSMSYGQFLQKRRQMASQRADESGRAAMLGGNVTDAFLAAKGRSTYSAPTMDPRAVDSRKAEEADYWAKQAERNKGIAARDAAERQKQQSGYEKARTAYTTRARADEDALTNYGSDQSNAAQDEATRRYNEGRYGTMSGARQGQQARRRRLISGGF